MAKKKSLFLTALMLICTLALSCVLLTACGPKEDEKAEYAITWEYKTEFVNITADGYDTLPTKALDGTEITFAAEPVTGYQVSVSPSTSVKKQDDGKYKFTVNKDLTIKITESKIIKDIEVVAHKTSFYEYDVVKEEDLTVTATYEVGDPELITNYTISYQTDGASNFRAGDTGYTVSVGNITKTITLDAAIQAAQDFNYAELEINDDGDPVLVVYGHYNVADATAESAKEAVEAYATECLERTTWANKAYEAEAIIDDNFGFELRLTVKEWTATETGHHYYFRYAIGGITADGQNIDCEVPDATCEPDANNDLPGANYIGEPLMGKDGTSFYIGNCQNWGGCIMIVAINANAPSVTVESLALKSEGDAAILYYTGTVKNMTEEDLAAYYFDYEDSEGSKPLTFTVDSLDAETGAFTIHVDVTEMPVGTNWLHKGVATGNLTTADTTTDGKDDMSVTVGEKTYSFAYSEYNCWQIVVA